MELSPEERNGLENLIKEPTIAVTLNAKNRDYLLVILDEYLNIPKNAGEPTVKFAGTLYNELFDHREKTKDE